MIPTNGPGMDGAPLSSTREREEAALINQVYAARSRLRTANGIRKKAELSGEVEEEMLDDIVAAEDRLEGAAKALAGFRGRSKP